MPAYTGPSGAFREIAAATHAGGGRLAAKLQTGCGYEMATVPFVPVPGILYRKYREMKALGIDSVMQCWLVGNYPGTQNAAAGELAFEDFTEDEDTFLTRLAAPEFWTLRFDLRSRFECRDKSHAQAYMRYRERFRVRTSWSVTDFRISPFASEEVFLSDKAGVRDSDLLDATRSQVGVSFRPVPQDEHLSATLFFMVLHGIRNGAQDWVPINIFGFEVAYAF